MAFNAANNPGFERELVPAGVHAAVCTILVDIGQRENTVYHKLQHKGFIAWEIPSIMQEREDRSTHEIYEVPAQVGLFFTVSLNERAHLRQIIESWRGRGFSEEELLGFDLFNVLGAACLINVIHEPDKKRPGKFKDKLAGVMRLPKGMERPVPVGPLLKWSPDEPEMFNQLPGWLQAQIKQGMPQGVDPSAAPMDPDDDPFNAANRVIPVSDPRSPQHTQRTSAILDARRANEATNGGAAAHPNGDPARRATRAPVDPPSPPVDAYARDSFDDFVDPDDDIPF